VWRLVSFFLVAWAAVAADPPESPLALRAFAVTESDGQAWRVNISVGNRSQTTLGGISVSVLPAGVAPWEIPSLEPGEWKNSTIALSAGNYRSLAAVVEYSVDKRVDAMAEPVALREPDKPWWPNTAAAVIPVALGALVGFMGAVVSGGISLKKERLTAELQWKRLLVEKYDAPYRLFLTRCDGVVDAGTLRDRFTDLVATALVPDHLRALITTGIQEVEKAADAAAQRSARDRFLAQLRAELLDPYRKE
jgi:hypothetical protein